MEFTFDQYKDTSVEKKDTPNNRLTNDVPIRTSEIQQQENRSAKPNDRASDDSKTGNNQSQLTRPLQSDDLRNRINQNQSAKPLQSDDLRNLINERREKQSAPLIDLTADGSDGSKDSRFKMHQDNVQLDKKPLVTAQKSSGAYPSNQPESQPTPTKPSTVHPPLAKNNPFYFDVSKPPTSNIQFNRMQDRLKQQIKVDAPSKPVQSVTANMERKSVNDRLQLARQVPSVPNVSVFMVEKLSFD